MKTLLLMLLFCGSAWGASTETLYEFINRMELKYGENFHKLRPVEELVLTSTASSRVPIEHHEPKDIDLFVTTVTLTNIQPEIEWECYEYKLGLPKSFENCWRWIGFREDGVVLHKKEE